MQIAVGLSRGLYFLCKLHEQDESIFEDLNHWKNYFAKTVFIPMVAGESKIACNF